MKEEGQKRSIFAAIADGLDKVLVWLSIVLCAVITVNMIIAVFFRYVLNNSIYWADELSLVLFAWLTFLGGSLAVKRSEMAAVTIILDRLSERGKRWVLVGVQISIIFFAFILGYYSLIWVQSPSVVNMVSSTLPVSMWTIYLIVPVSMICIIIFSLDNLRKVLTGNQTEEGGVKV